MPDAYLKEDKPLNKLSYYEKAAADSAKLEKLIRNDPYYQQQTDPANKEIIPGIATQPSSLKYNEKTSTQNNNLNTSPYGRDAAIDPNEAKVYQKLEQLNTALKKAEGQPASKSTAYPSLAHDPGTAMNQVDIDRLEQMMALMKNGDGSEDPEMQQINSLLEKILDIQHPKRVREKIQPSTEKPKNQILAVAANNKESITLLGNDKATAFTKDTIPYGQISFNGFYSLEDDAISNPYPQNAIPAVVHETQTLVEGSMVKLRLINDILLNGERIPAGNFVFGTASLNGERLHIKINSIRYKNSLFPVALAVFDLDGLNGLYTPGAVTREVAKQSTDRAVQGIGLTTLDPSLGAQAASASIEAAKTLFNKKTKLIKITVKAGYQVLLQDQRQKASS